MGGEGLTDEDAIFMLTEKQPVENFSTPLEKTFSELERQKRSIRAIEYTLTKREVRDLMRDPVFWVAGMSHINKNDAIGFRAWCNKEIYGFEDVSIFNLRQVASSLGVKSYGSKTKDQLLAEIVQIRKDANEKTAEELEDERVVGEDPDDDFLHPKTGCRSKV